MKVRIVTALFDIKRDTLGDGRKIDDYLIWFRETLKLKCDMTIYTEEQFVNFIKENRTNGYYTDIVIQKLTEIPFYHWKDKISDIITSQNFKVKMKDCSRIECYLPEYNIIQYSKFGWLKKTTDKNRDCDYFFWMDAGCSRFFDGFDLSKDWPNITKLDISKFTIQGNTNYVNMFNQIDIDNYIWDNNSMLVGTLFGCGRDIVYKIEQEINKIFEWMMSKDCVNNEQFALALFAKKNSEIMNTIVHLDGTHLPLFKILS